MPAQLDLGFVLNFMRKPLEGKDTINYGEFLKETYRHIVNAGVIIKPRDAQSHNYIGTVNRDYPLLSNIAAEACQHLLHNGFITRPPEVATFPGNRNDNEFLVTRKGKEWARGHEPIPEDVAGFMLHLETLIPKLDRVIKKYVQEALTTYERQAYFAAAVMIGAAAESAVYLLAAAMQKSLASKLEKSRLIKASNERRLPSLFKIISDNLERAKKKKLIPYSVHEGSDPHLRSFFEAIRVQRNDAVHPAAAKVKPDAVRLSILAFPLACKKVHDLVDWLEANKI